MAESVRGHDRVAARVKTGGVKPRWKSGRANRSNWLGENCHIVVRMR